MNIQTVSLSNICYTLLRKKEARYSLGESRFSGRIWRLLYSFISLKLLAEASELQNLLPT